MCLPPTTNLRVGGPGSGSMLLVLALAAGLSGCVMKRETYDVPVVEVPDRFKYAPSTAATAEDVGEVAPATVPQNISRWWRHFENEELNGLVEQALANNRLLKAAVSRIAQAQALAGVEGADEWPQISASGSFEMEQPEGGIGSVPQGGDSNIRRTYQVGVEASYEVDFWGKNRAKTQAAYERAWASVFDRETVVLTLVSDVVRNFVEYLSLQDRIANADWTRETLTNMLGAVRERVDGGEATAIQLAQQNTAVAASRAVIPELELQRNLRVNALAVLLGTTPSAITLKSEGLADIKFPDVTPGVPSRLVLRRPDIRRNESNLAAADADIDAARAELVPALNLTAEAGYGARHLNLLFVPESFFFNLGAVIAQSIFDGGRRRAQIKFEEAQHAELVHNYVQSVYTAIGEVENALVSIKYLSERERLQAEAVTAAVEAYGFSQESYRIGASDYLTLLDTERTLFTERDELHRIAFSRYVASIDLFQALGGSMAPDEVPKITRNEAPHISTSPPHFADQKARQPLMPLVPNLPAAGHWVHVATLWSERAAWRHWRRLKAEFPSLLAEVTPQIHRQTMDHKRGTWVNVLVGPYQLAGAANGLCQDLKKGGNGCQVLRRE